MNAPPLRYKTPFGGYAVKFSPFEDNRVAAATAQNYGIIGNGKQLVLEVTPTGLVPIAGLDTRDGLYDCAWSEENENVLASASGDGSIKVWDLKLPPNANPIRSLQEHRHEVYGLDWNSLKRSLLLSASWDDSVKLWDLNHPHSLRTFRNHTYCVYSAAWNPRHGDVFLSASGDCTVNIWDQRRQASTLKLRCHDFEVLSADWCKYNDCVIATASVDKTLRVWDVRAPKQPLNTLLGHTYAVRRVQFSPYAETVLMSCSYDMTIRLWDFAAPGQPCLQVCDHHTEFAVGCHFSTLQEGLLASAGWDGDIVVWKSPLTRGRSPLPPPR